MSLMDFIIMEKNKLCQEIFDFNLFTLINIIDYIQEKAEVYKL